MVEFIESDHTYLNDGIIVPSVTQIVSWVMGDDFSHIPQKTLQAKAKYGTEIHELIYAYENGMTEKELDLSKDIEPMQKAAVKQYIFLKKGRFKVKNMEQIVTNGKVCGRYDILTTKGELIDIKTTYKLHMDHLRWQLGLYYYLMGKDTRRGYVMWLPKQKIGEFIPVDCHSAKECEEIIGSFFNSNR